jgi:hypothetical protein
MLGSWPKDSGTCLTALLIVLRLEELFSLRRIERVALGLAYIVIRNSKVNSDNDKEPSSRFVIESEKSIGLDIEWACLLPQLTPYPRHRSFVSSVILTCIQLLRGIMQY